MDQCQKLSSVEFNGICTARAYGRDTTLCRRLGRTESGKIIVRGALGGYPVGGRVRRGRLPEEDFQ